MASMLQLSRSSFYRLVGTVFPKPVKHNCSRPYYDQEGMQKCLEIKKSKCGMDGTPVLFYSKSTKPRRTKKKKENKYENILIALESLGLVVSQKHIEATIQQLFPNGIADFEEENVIREMFLHISTKEND